MRCYTIGYDKGPFVDRGIELDGFRSIFLGEKGEESARISTCKKFPPKIVEDHENNTRTLFDAYPKKITNGVKGPFTVLRGEINLNPNEALVLIDTGNDAHHALQGKIAKVFGGFDVVASVHCCESTTKGLSMRDEELIVLHPGFFGCITFEGVSGVFSLTYTDPETGPQLKRIS